MLPYDSPSSINMDDAIMEIVDSFDSPKPYSSPKDIPLEPVEAFGEEEPPRLPLPTAHSMNVATAFEPQIAQAYSLFPSPPYSI